MKHKKQTNPFKDMQGAAVGMAGLGLTTAVGAGFAAQAPAGTPSLMGGFTTLTSFAPIGATAIGGMSVLKMVKGKKIASTKYFKTKKEALTYIKRGQKQGWSFGSQKLIDNKKEKVLGYY